jgi:hypothetical protein
MVSHPTEFPATRPGLDAFAPARRYTTRSPHPTLSEAN